MLCLAIVGRIRTVDGGRDPMAVMVRVASRRCGTLGVQVVAAQDTVLLSYFDAVMCWDPFGVSWVISHAAAAV